MVRGSVLVVCTGNVCRSPYFEFMLRSMLPHARIDIASAGTQALEGTPMDPTVLRLVEERGIDPSGFAARQITAEMIRKADLILTATRAHRGKVAHVDPSGVRKAMAMGDFADLVRGSPAVLPEPSFMDPPQMSDVALIASGAARRRGTVPLRPDHEVDILDPYGKAERVFERMAEQIDADLEPIVRALGTTG